MEVRDDLPAPIKKNPHSKRVEETCERIRTMRDTHFGKWGRVASFAHGSSARNAKATYTAKFAGDLNGLTLEMEARKSDDVHGLWVRWSTPTPTPTEGTECSST